LSHVPAALLLRHRRELWAAACALLLVTLSAFALGLFEPIEHRFSEVRARILDRPPSGQVAIVEIDGKSLARLNSWPWSRRYHAGLIERLGAAGASIIAFDVDFSARSTPGDDQLLGRALDHVQPVILPVFQQRASDNLDVDALIKSRPAAPFRKAWTGGVNILPGPDGVVRDFPAATLIDGEIQPALAVLLSDNGSLGDRTFVPDWSIDVQRIRRFSFVDVLEGRVPARALAGKRIIVGATAIELGDRYTIPRFGTVPGVVIQALATESLLQHRAMTRSGLIPTVAGLLLAAFLLVGRFNRFSRTFPAAAAGLVATLLAIPLAVQARWPVSIDTAPALIATAAAIALRLLLEARQRIRLAELRDIETGLPNRRALVALIDDSAGAGLHLTAAAIDRFELIRSALPSADVTALVGKAAERIEALVDSAVYRIAPDTLAWVVPAGSDPETACAKVAGSFDRPVDTGTSAVDVAWTFGLATRAPEAGSGALIERAQSALNDARTGGRSHQWFRGIGAEALRNLSIMGELRRGIDENQLFVAYQPKLHLKSGAIAQAEALVRWRHPVEGLIAPDRFIPLAEETGVVREITRFVLARAIADCREANRTNRSIAVSVNVSAADVEEPGFVDELVNMLATANLRPHQLTLEITESAFISSKEMARDVLDALRREQVRLSIDDYGTGQSTLSYLKTFPVDELKIDKLFVTQLCATESDRIMVASTVDLAHQLGLSVVAEGAEDWDTIRVLTELGCDYAQGYAVGRAMPFADLLRLSTAQLSKAA